MAFDWASGLLSLSESAPRVGAAFDAGMEAKRRAQREEEERKRQALMDMLAQEEHQMNMATKQQSLDDTKLASQRQQDAIGSIGAAQGDIASRDTLSTLGRGLTWTKDAQAQAAQTPTDETKFQSLPSALGADLGRIRGLADKTDTAIVQERTGQFSDVPAVQDFQKPYLDQEKSARDAAEAARLQEQQDQAAMDRLKYSEGQANYRAGMTDRRARENSYTERTFALKPNQNDNLTAFDNALTQLRIIKNTFKPDYVGPIKGRWGGAKEAFGVLGKDETTFRTAKQEFDNMLLKLRSGTAVTPPEFERLRKEVGNPNTQSEQFLAAVDRATTSLQNQKSIYANGLKKAGYNLGEWENEIQPVQDYSKQEQGSSVSDDDIISKYRKVKK